MPTEVFDNFDLFSDTYTDGEKSTHVSSVSHSKYGTARAVPIEQADEPVLNKSISDTFNHPFALVQISIPEQKKKNYK